jgi:hypothetical protein
MWQSSKQHTTFCCGFGTAFGIIQRNITVEQKYNSPNDAPDDAPKESPMLRFWKASSAMPELTNCTFSTGVTKNKRQQK